MHQETDDKIAELIKVGDLEKAFRLLLSEFKRPLYYKLREMLPSHADTDDVLQNTFVKIWSNLGKFQGKSKVFSWCYRIAINESLHWIAKNKKHQASPLNDTVTPVVSQSAHLYTDGNEIASMLSRAVDTLPEQQKRVFELRYYEDMKYAEIAQQLSLSPGGLKANYHHAVKKIEAFIKLNATH